MIQNTNQNILFRFILKIDELARLQSKKKSEALMIT